MQQTLAIPSHRILIVCGHYGVGKTNFSLNLARDRAQLGRKVTIVDLDIVNPYFRSSDYLAEMDSFGVNVVAPVLANTSLDTPSLSASVQAVLEQAACDEETFVIVDVGGDDVGATALGRFRPAIEAAGYDFVYVVNAYRNMTSTPEEAYEILQEIEARCLLKATALVANSHLKQLTTAQTVLNALPFARACATLCQLPLWLVCVPNNLLNEHEADSIERECGENVYPVSTIVKTPWE